MQILDRVELDKPILMHDKLEVIWDKEDQSQEQLNQYQVKTHLESLKAKRSVHNKHAVRAYTKLLEYIEKRLAPCSYHERRGIKIDMHEKEREFFDCLRLIIRNGYELTQPDVLDLLKFIQIHEILWFDYDD